MVQSQALAALNETSLYAIVLSPSAHLVLECVNNAAPPNALLPILQQFSLDWRAGWFYLAAYKSFTTDEPAVRFWRDIAIHYVTALCHLAPEQECTSLSIPNAECLTKWLERAPPMNGGEYLSSNMLLTLWNELDTWVCLQAKEHGGIHQFLSQAAPDWQQVGRVCFHLAENKLNTDRPFAFLATYSTGFGLEGKLKYLPLKEALKQYSGENNCHALIKLLTPVQKASEKCPWVQDLVSTAELYQPLAWTSDKAFKLLCSIPELEESGLAVRIPNWWKKRARPQLSVTIGSAKQAGIGANAMLDFDVHMALDGEQLTEQELHELLNSQKALVPFRGQWVEVDRDKLQEAIDHWKQVQKLHKSGQMSFIEGMRLLAGAPSELQDKVQSHNSWVKIEAGQALKELLSQLRDPSQISSQKLDAVSFSLRPYQHEGVNWMALLSSLGLGACLADDMGLGKTIQVLTLLLLKQHCKQEERARPSLLVVPASLLANWQREAAKFTPSLKLFLLHPSLLTCATTQKIEKNPEQFFTDFDLVITTYSMVSRIKWLSSITWSLFILDEAQAIKNAGTQQTKAVKAISSKARIALTGTPIENRLSDLWSLFDFLNPGLLGSAARFKEYVSSLQALPESFESLRKLTAPYILRRMKTDPKIISDLPQKIETAAYCHLTKLQTAHYQAIVDNLRKTLEHIDTKQRRGVVLNALMQLKQVCNHPCHYLGSQVYDPSHSGKFERLGQICEELAMRQEKILVFTQFSEIIGPLEAYLSQIFGKRGLQLDGSTPIKRRQELVEIFQQLDGPPFFVLSLKAGGTGLTLTQASHVIHFDRWWNPAVENQATDRAFRIGQKKHVQVHKFITQGTVEEQIDAIITSKKKLAEEVLHSDDEVKITELGDEELLQLLSLNIDQATTM